MSRQRAIHAGKLARARAFLRSIGWGEPRRRLVDRVGPPSRTVAPAEFEIPRSIRK